MVEPQQINQSGADAARLVMEQHVAALNARDEQALADTLHFPHYRLSDNGLKVWEDSSTYFSDFYARAGKDWHHTMLKQTSIVAASAEKVHLDVWFDRCREDDSVISSFRSLWVIAKLDGRWAAQLRSSFAPDKTMMAQN